MTNVSSLHEHNSLHSASSIPYSYSIEKVDWKNLLFLRKNKFDSLKSLVACHFDGSFKMDKRRGENHFDRKGFRDTSRTSMHSTIFNFVCQLLCIGKIWITLLLLPSAIYWSGWCGFCTTQYPAKMNIRCQ